MLRLLRRLMRDRRGAVAIYGFYVGTLIIGAAVVAVDFGRLTVLRTQMQNAADAAATAAAAQLDGAAGATARAADVARNAARQDSGLILGGGQIEVASLAFFRDEAFTAALGDRDARAVRVTLAPAATAVLFRPVLDILSGASASDEVALGAVAAAINAPISCEPVPLMVCLDASAPWSFRDRAGAAGRQVALRERDQSSGGDVALFRLICPPPLPDCMEADLQDYLDAEAADQCVADPDRPAEVFDPATVEDGVNERFGDTESAAPNVIYYDRDPMWQAGDPMTDGAYGDGAWDVGGYWLSKHGTALPAALSAASRYQVYLYELGRTFARAGKRTLYPVPDDGAPPGYALVIPPAVGVPENDADHQNEAVDGLADAGDSPNPDPQPPLTAAAGRRVVTAATARCGAVAGWAWSGGYVKLFLTERAQGFTIFAEVVGPVEAPEQNFVQNVRIIQ